MYNFYPKKLVQPPGCAPNILLIMKLTTIILITAMLHASAKTVAQTVTLSVKNATLSNVIDNISKQTGYDFLISTEILNRSKPVTVILKDKDLQSTLEKVFEGQSMAFTIQDKIIIVSGKENTKIQRRESIQEYSIHISGKVTDYGGRPLAGATIKIKRQSTVVITDSEGVFKLDLAGDEATLMISFIGYQPIDITVTGSVPQPMIIKLIKELSPLSEVQVIGYGSTTKRNNTGNVSSVTASEISRQPVSNPIAAMAGRVPGLSIAQNNGIAGSGYKIQIRGQSSLLQGSDPLFIIDGVPFAAGNAALNLITSAAGSGSGTYDGISPLNLINPDDIDRIDILKDADATAIYGSRGANGVVLITTKKGKKGRTEIGANVYSGFSKVTRTMKMLDTKGYLNMRREGFLNDGITPDVTNAPDLLLWDTTRYTDFKKSLIGNTAHTTNADLSVSSGSAGTTFLMSGSYHRETTVFPTSQGNSRGAFHASINHVSPDNKFSVSLNTVYASNNSNLTVSDLTGLINTAPNLKTTRPDGSLNWEEGGTPFINLGLLNANPYSFQNQTYQGSFQNLNANMQVGYKITSELNFKVSLGYNTLNSNEVNLYPSTSLDPFLGQLPFSNFGHQSMKSWIIEPQAEYVKDLGKGRLSFLLGNTWQNITRDGVTIGAFDYSGDALLRSIAAASYTETVNAYSQYRYTGAYGRINYNLAGKYLFNLSGRRDGSSRFGPSNRFSNFGALGAAWLFGDEQFIKNNLPVISYGKVRASYGVSGNDQIGDYRYLNTWSPGNTTYQGKSILNPSSLYNPNFSWEKNRKLELAFDLGFWRDRLLLSAAYYNNKANNQLINYTLASQTGFTSVLQNFNAEIANTGFEFTLSGRNIESKNFRWTTDFNVTLPKNKLLGFPGLSNSSYANTYIIGQSLSSRKVYHYQGVNPTSGIYQFQDVDDNGILDVNDRTVIKNTDVRFYGGLQNTFRLRSFELSFLLEFRKQNGYNYLSNLGGNVPGYSFTNQPVIVLERWQHQGDNAPIQKFISAPGGALDAAIQYLPGSDAVISDASYLRLKNIYFSYDLPSNALTKFGVRTMRIYLQGQNILTWTNYKGADPENQNLYSLPPLRTLTAGIQLTL
ncbi:SusC/RagA family TonB-linked outer membrane protein [Mucilaginibacter sp. 10B2]|uniref:SusC/RagA family TonB-linked outer membrane protein n=1 Tax=Mucilaginibacter sp. 10B2 TaxID=3048574 RepID=UPI002B233C23|nr:SusC/RagA family TonB-linked outer membrane protein [Mucilaginibacter sp. 10B2]MEB0280686.1 SusC/RagA family TonB-linked outer membrane protein [Mucilaginibacter sp. 10B2]